MNHKDFNVKLLYFGHGNISKSTTSRHCHAYFQLEYCRSGQLNAIDNGKKVTLNPGDCWLIPSGVIHKFSKGFGNLDYFSIKFTTSASLKSRIINDPVCQYYLDLICSIVEGKSSFSPYNNEGKSIIETHLQGILQYLALNNISSSPSQFLLELQSLICEYGATSNINDFSEKFKLSRAEFKYRFLQETGHSKIKEYIDNILLNVTEQHMKYSDIPLNKIAEQMNFSSIYAFSRYYKHHRGITPSKFRKGDGNLTMDE